MGQRELLLLLGAVVLFGTATVTKNRYVVEQNESMLQRELELYAIALAQSYIEEAKTKAFDKNVVNTSSSLPEGLTAPPLRPDPGEKYPYFDEVHDFNGLALAHSSGRVDFHVSITVEYVEAINPEVAANSATHHKKMAVTVTENSYLGYPVRLSHVFSYIKN
jgi:hypothetical protein